MTRRVADRCEQPDAGSDLSVILDKPPVLPRREYIGDALAGGPAAFSQFLDPAGLRPPLVFSAVDDQFGIGKDGRVGALLHQSPDVIGMEVRDQDRTDLAAVD